MENPLLYEIIRGQGGKLTIEGIIRQINIESKIEPIPTGVKFATDNGSIGAVVLDRAQVIGLIKVLLDFI